jgi:hypothetical protein
MPASLRFAQVLLIVAAAVVALATLVTLSLMTRLGPIGFVALVTAVLTLYALTVTVVALQRGAAWGPVAAFWALCLFVLSGVIEMIRAAPTLHLPILGILATITIAVLPAGSRSLLPDDERRPPTPVAVAYVVALVATVVAALVPPTGT